MLIHKVQFDCRECSGKSGLQRSNFQICGVLGRKLDCKVFEKVLRFHFPCEMFVYEAVLGWHFGYTVLHVVYCALITFWRGEIKPCLKWRLEDIA